MPWTHILPSYALLIILVVLVAVCLSELAHLKDDVLRVVERVQESRVFLRTYVHDGRLTDSLFEYLRALYSARFVAHHQSCWDVEQEDRIHFVQFMAHIGVTSMKTRSATTALQTAARNHPYLASRVWLMLHLPATPASPEPPADWSIDLFRQLVDSRFKEGLFHAIYTHNSPTEYIPNIENCCCALEEEAVGKETPPLAPSIVQLGDGQEEQQAPACGPEKDSCPPKK